MKNKYFNDIIKLRCVAHTTIKKMSPSKPYQSNVKSTYVHTYIPQIQTNILEILSQRRDSFVVNKCS